MCVIGFCWDIFVVVTFSLSFFLSYFLSFFLFGGEGGRGGLFDSNLIKKQITE